MWVATTFALQGSPDSTPWEEGLELPSALPGSGAYGGGVTAARVCAMQCPKDDTQQVLVFCAVSKRAQGQSEDGHVCVRLSTPFVLPLLQAASPSQRALATCPPSWQRTTHCRRPTPCEYAVQLACFKARRVAPSCKVMRVLMVYQRM